jgi:hypothetical protein
MNPATPQPRLFGWLAIGIFLLAGAAMATIAGITLIMPGTFLDRMWALNKAGHAGLASMGKTVGFLFPVLGLALAAAGIGWLKRRYWGWFLAVLLIGGNALGDLIRFASGDWIAGAVGVVIAGSLLFYITRPRVQNFFHR